MSRCQIFLHLEQPRTPLPLKPAILTILRSSKKQELHVFDVLNSSIVTTINSLAASYFFKVAKSFPITPHRNPFILTISLPKTPAPKTTNGYFSLFSWKGKGHYFKFSKKKSITSIKERLIAYFFSSMRNDNPSSPFLSFLSFLSFFFFRFLRDLLYLAVS